MELFFVDFFINGFKLRKKNKTQKISWMFFADVKYWNSKI